MSSSVALQRRPQRRLAVRRPLLLSQPARIRRQGGQQPRLCRAGTVVWLRLLSATSSVRRVTGRLPGGGAGREAVCEPLRAVRNDRHGGRPDGEARTNHALSLDGAVTLRVRPERPAKFALCLRIPGWVQASRCPAISMLTRPHAVEVVAACEWRTHRSRTAARFRRHRTRMERRRHRGARAADARAPRGRAPEHRRDARLVALERGPVVYAFEGMDNDGSVSMPSCRLPPR